MPSKTISPSLVSSLPRLQVERLVSGWLSAGTYGAGDLLPTASEIARLCDDVSKSTVRRALKELVEEGVLIGVPGKGVYVSQRKGRRAGAKKKAVSLKK